VSKERETGESKWFIEHTMLDRFNSGFVKISLYTEFFNTRAINFWSKLGFEEKKI
jgi:ribosomal protein S18 acetylase RimI-like enzyme